MRKADEEKIAELKMQKAEVSRRGRPLATSFRSSSTLFQLGEQRRKKKHWWRTGCLFQLPFLMFNDSLFTAVEKDMATLLVEKSEVAFVVEGQVVVHVSVASLLPGPVGDC